MSKSEKIKGNILCDLHRTYSLCNYCLKCDCSWMRDCVPIDGWAAARLDYKRAHKKTVDTYHVFYCPMFAEGVGTGDD